jgi:dipeptidase D
MVCEKNSDSTHDFSRDPIEFEITEEWLKAAETSLGADNGIGVAAMLAILADASLQLGELECLFTVDEETGLTGALQLDPTMIQGRILLNLDTEEVGAVYIGCAGGRDSDIYLPMVAKKTAKDMAALQIGITGLKGGHSGAKIHLGRANAVKLMARILNSLNKSGEFFISSIHGGDKDNAIPRETFCIIILENKNLDTIRRSFQEFSSELKEEVGAVDPAARFEIHEHALPLAMFDQGSTQNLINLLMTMPHGVLSMSALIEDLVQTSTNLSSIRTEDKRIHIHASHRSSVESALVWVCDLHVSLSVMAHARVEQDDGYPGWDPDPNSSLLKVAKAAVERVLGRAAEVRAIHAGLECGVIKKKFDGMEAISIGPTIKDPHSPDESVLIESVQNFWDILIQTLRSIISDAAV